MKTTQLNEKQIAQWSRNWQAEGARLGFLAKEPALDEPEHETANCSRCDAVLTYELQKGFTELESFQGAADSAEWEERNRELLCPICLERDSFYRDENLGR